jgi:hypothetical protein
MKNMIRNSHTTLIKIMAMLAALLYPILPAHASAQVTKTVQDARRSLPRIELDRPEQAAEFARDVLRQIGKEKEDVDYAASLGFDSPEELRRAQIGLPLQVYHISLERLKAFQKDSSLKTLVNDSRILMYPLLVDRQLKSIMTIEPSSTTGWYPTGVGYVQVATLLQKNRPDGADVLIFVSDLGLKFLGLRPIGPPSDEDFLVLPLTLAPGPPPRSARETFAELSAQVSERKIYDSLQRPSIRGTPHQ